MTASRIYIVTGTLPGDRGVGEIILRDFVSASPDLDVGFFGLVARSTGLPSGTTGKSQLVGYAKRRYETAFRPLPGWGGAVISAVALASAFRMQVKRVVQQAVHAGRQYRPQALAVILDCPTSLFAATSIANRLQLPLRVLVWDAPELFAKQLHYDPLSTRALERQFHSVLREAQQIAVVGETMQQTYRDRYNVDSQIVRHGLGADAWQPTSAAPQSTGDLTIGFAGSLTAPDAFHALIQHLNAHSWRCAGRRVTLRLIGSRYLLDASVPQCIEYFGWRSVEETVRLLADCDVLYLPQPFSESLRMLAELSFPTKLSTYLAAGRPILLHAPAHGSIVPFFQRYPFGVWCSSLDMDDLGTGLQRLAGDTGVLEQARLSIGAAREEELNAGHFVRSFRRFLGVAPEQQSSSQVAAAAEHSPLSPRPVT